MKKNNYKDMITKILFYYPILANEIIFRIISIKLYSITSYYSF
jgi:hypothetical protein